MRVTVRYFASMREAMGTSSEVLDTAATTLAQLRAELMARGGVYADRLRTEGETLLRLPALIRRIEEQFPQKGGAPPQPPLPEVRLLWQGSGRGVWRYVLAAIAGGAAAWAAMAGGLLQ